MFYNKTWGCYQLKHPDIFVSYPSVFICLIPTFQLLKIGVLLLKYKGRISYFKA